MKMLDQGQRGFSLISTLFVLVVLAALAGYIVKISTVQHLSSGMSAQSSRAWFAALSGLEWAVYEIRNNGSCPAVPTSFSADGFTIEVDQCSSANIQEGSDHYSLYAIEVTARRGTFGSADYVSRTVQATVSG